MRLSITVLALIAGFANDDLRAQSAEARMLVQNSPLAGFQYYQGRGLWDKMKTGDTLTLTREVGNPHDANAVRVEWRGQPLGYVPRRENRTVAQHMDRGVNVEARISRLQKHPNAWQRIEFEIFVILTVQNATADERR